MDEMDSLEQMAWDLEEAQAKRHRKAKGKDSFWTVTEMEIFNTIKLFRSKSRTFHPDNLR